MHTISEKSNGSVFVNGEPYNVGDFSISYKGNPIVEIRSKLNERLSILKASYTEITNPITAAPFASFQALKDFIQANFFDEATGEGGVTESELAAGMDNAKRYADSKTPVTPQMFYVEGAVDWTDAFLETTNYSRVHYPKGFYEVSQDIVYPAGVHITSDGIDEVTIEGYGDAANFSGTNSVLTITGETPIDIGYTTVIPIENDSTITMEAGHGLEADDVIMILDETDFSFSLSRPYYKEGEFLEVKNVEGDTIYLKSRIVGDKYSVNAKVCKLTKGNSTIEGVTIRSMNEGVVTALKVRYLTSGTINNVRVENSLYAGLAIQKCCNIVVNGGFQNKDTDQAGTSYGIVISNCQNVVLDKVTASSYRHALTTGGDLDYCVVNRFIKAVNSTFKSANGVGVGAFEFHGNTEKSGAINCTFIGGMVAAGRRNYYDRCDIYQDPAGNGSPIWTGEINEASISFTNCNIHAFQRINSRGVWGNIYFEDAVVTRGTFSMKNNTFHFTNKNTEVSQKNGLDCYFYGDGTNLVDLEFVGNKFINNDADNILVALRVHVEEIPEVVSYYNSIQVIGNTFEKCTNVIDHCNNVIVGNKNVMKDSKYYAFMVRNSGMVYFEENVIINPNQENSGSSTTNTAVFVSGCTALHNGGNSFFGGAFTNYSFSLSVVTNLHGRTNLSRGVILREYCLITVTNVFGEVSHNNTPNGNYVAGVGVKYREINGQIDGMAMIKTTPTLSTGWRPILIVNSSNTGGRPAVTTVGWYHFDTQLGKPIWLKSTAPNVWVDATGTTV